MSLLPLYEYPDPILRQKAEPVTKFDDELRTFLNDMLETMYADHGAGLAAPQVGVSKRMIVLDAEQEDDENGNHKKMPQKFGGINKNTYLCKR